MSCETDLLGTSAPMESLRRLLPKVASARRTTLILGPTGTGKEVVARKLHLLGQPDHAPYVTVHCGAIPEQLVESELFGHARGAFTGATAARAGLVRAAHRGTLFLDEIDSLGLPLQAKLLRFLESGEYRSVGSDVTETASAWVIAASNADLHDSARRAAFRSDLLFRLEVMRVVVPPLSVRGEDVLVLADHFLARAGQGRYRLGASAVTALKQHQWPGNVRELKHCIERAVALADATTLEETDLGLRRQPASPVPAVPMDPLAATLADLVEREGLSLAEAMERCERALIATALKMENGNRTKAAQRLGIHVRTMFKKLPGVGDEQRARSGMPDRS